MKHPTDSPGSSKPSKPTPDFPLTPRKDGRWMKRIWGKLHYFTGTAEQARDKYEALIETLGPSDPGILQIRHLCEQFMCAKESDKLSGQLSTRTFRAYHLMCDVIVAHFGRLRPLDALTRQDAEALRVRICRDVGIKTMADRINHARIVFKWGHDHELFPKAFHPWIKTVDKKTLKRYQSQRPSRSMTASEIHLLLDNAAPTMYAMILLGVNCGFGNSDCADLTLQWLDLDNGWHSFARPKTGEPRRGKLWPETVRALRLVISSRPTPLNPQHADHVFLTRKRTLYVPAERTRDAVGAEFRRVAERAGILRPGVSFYSLRHVHETIGGGCCDQVSVNLSMGHSDSSMAANYRSHVADERLAALAQHIHRWLFGQPEVADQRKGLRVVG